jgi:hypothetical protein
MFVDKFGKERSSYSKSFLSQTRKNSGSPKGAAAAAAAAEEESRSPKA